MPGAKKHGTRNLRWDISDDDLQGLVAVIKTSGKVLKQNMMKSDTTQIF